MAKGKYKRKRIRKQLRETAIVDMDLSAHTVKALTTAGLTNLEDLMSRNEEEIGAIHGIGDKAMAEIRRVINERQVVYHS